MLIRILFLAFCIVLAMNLDTFSQTTFPVENGVSQTLAQWRAANYSNVRYRLNITLGKGKPLMLGEMELAVTLTEEGTKNDLIIDWRTTQFEKDKDKPYADITEINGQKAPPIVVVNEHLKVPRSFLKAGENVLKIEFGSPIKTSGAAVTRYIDREDGGEYIYSLFVPSDASTAFPCFDQPDLKGKFSLTVLTVWPGTGTWGVISNTSRESIVKTGVGIAHKFKETQPISTYVFAFAAGDFVSINESFFSKDLLKFSEPRQTTIQSDVRNENGKVEKQLKKVDEGLKIYVRRSQAEKFKQHATEVFRLNREGVKFLEGYFDYKFPFSKYDLVLIPEFPFGGMEHAGATFLRESSVIFPQEPTANDYISRANVIFHEAAHQWFGDTVTMRWFDDLWLKEGFAEFMAYKTLEKTMPQYNAWKVFYERNKQAAYLTDSTKGTTPIYQEIPNLSAAKSAYGNIVYRKAPSFLKQAEFYFGPDKFQLAVRSFLKKHQFANAGWKDLVKEFEDVKINEKRNEEYYQTLSERDKNELIKFIEWHVNLEWADFWVRKPGMPTYRISPGVLEGDGLSVSGGATGGHTILMTYFTQRGSIENYNWLQNIKVLKVYDNGDREEAVTELGNRKYATLPDEEARSLRKGEYTFSTKFDNETEKPGRKPLFVFPNYQDYGYGVFLLDEKSKKYILENIRNENDDFLRSMMWGSLWDSVREAELDPKDYVELVIKNLGTEKDEVTIAGLLGRVGAAMNYYLPEKQREEFAPRVEDLLIEKILTTKAQGQKLTYYRSFLNIASSEKARSALKDILKGNFAQKGPTINVGQQTDDRSAPPTDKLPHNYVLPAQITLKTKDKFDIVTKLLILGDKDAPELLAELEKTETSDEAKRYAYAAKAGIASAENKAKYFGDFVGNKEISESWIEAAFGPFNSIRHSELTLPYLEKALAELPNLKRSRKIFFVNGWLGAFIGGQRSEQALQIVNKFLADNPNLDKDLRLKVLENADNLERAVKIRARFGK